LTQMQEQADLTVKFQKNLSAEMGASFTLKKRWEILQEHNYVACRYCAN